MDIKSPIYHKKIQADPTYLAVEEPQDSSLLAEEETKESPTSLFYKITQKMSTPPEYNELIHILIHDLRTPLASIVGYLDLFEMNRRIHNTKSEQYVTKARWGGEELALLCQNVADALAMEKKELVPQLKKCDFGRILKRILEKIKPLTSHFQKSINLKCPENMKPLECDEYLLERVIYNILYHCLQNIQPKQSIELSVEQDTRKIYFEILDTGHSIANEHVSFFFDKFFALQCSKGSRRPRGFNLYFAKLAVNLHHGKVWLQKNDNTHKFCLILPLQPSE